MTQHPPPGAGQGPDAHESHAHSFAPDGEAERNPYLRSERTAAQPDLDAGSPVLTAIEAQRLNRKALFFLAGIVALLLLLGYFVLWGSGGDGEEAPAPRAERQVAIPEAPTVPQVEAAPPPVDVLPLLPEAAPEPVASYRTTGDGDPAGGSQGPRPPSLMERRMVSAGGEPGAEGGAGDGDASSQAAMLQAQQMQALQNAMLGLPPGGAAPPTVAEPDASAQFMSNPDALLLRGTYLRCVLETRIVTDIPGFTSCILTEPVYSANGRRLLLPKGSRILGRYGEQEDGMARVAVVWDRVITPTGIDVSMSSPGVDGLGGAGHPGDYSGHWGSKIMSALLISLVSDAFQWGAAEHGPRSSTVISGPGGATVVDQPFESATARSMERLANQALQKSANRRGTTTINQGTVVNVYVAQDVDFTSVLAVR